MNDLRRALPLRDSYSPVYASCHHQEAPRETISISIDGGASSIVLPRGHDLVKHLESLMPDLAAASRHHESPTTVAHHPTSSFRFPAMNHLPMDRPHSPYHSDSSASSAAPYRMSATPDQVASGRHTGYRRRRGAAGYAAPTGKKCQIEGCQKISVSRGLCRGHGGGRRCQYSGCSKGAQSRSDYCWAHGGGQRCEVKNCMRSRKSKRFCVAHLSWEDHVAPIDVVVTSVKDYHRSMDVTPKQLMPRVHAPELHQSPPPRMGSPSLFNEHKLPSLQQALRKNLYDNTPEPAQRFHHHHHHPTAVYGVIG